MKVTYYFPGCALNCLNHQWNKSVKNEFFSIAAALWRQCGISAPAASPLCWGGPFWMLLYLTVFSDGSLFTIHRGKCRIYSQDEFSSLLLVGFFFFLVLLKLNLVISFQVQQDMVFWLGKAIQNTHKEFKRHYRRWRYLAVWLLCFIAEHHIGPPDRGLLLSTEPRTELKYHLCHPKHTHTRNNDIKRKQSKSQSGRVAMCHQSFRSHSSIFLFVVGFKEIGPH